MKLGKDTGSLVNHVMSQCGNVELPNVGDGATLLSWSDREPATVVEVFKKGKFDYVVVQNDDYKRTDKNGLSECQEYEYSRNEDGYKTTFRLKNGKWEKVHKNENGRWVKSGTGGVFFGKREKYHDFSF